MASTIHRSRGQQQQFVSGNGVSGVVEHNELNGNGECGDGATGAAANGSNWLADLSVEVCKVNEDVDSCNSQSGVGGVNGEGGEGSAGDWDEAVVFFEAAAAAEAVCCSSDASGQTQHQHQHQQDNGHDHLDVLLGNPNLHNSSIDNN